MSRIVALGLFLLFVSLAAGAAEVPPLIARDTAPAPAAGPAVDLSTLMNGLQAGSCAARKAGVPLVLAQPLQAAASQGTGDLPNICCDCGGYVCCPPKGTCVSCGGILCICCNPE